MDFSKGKKRKRDAVPADVRKGAGKLMKFDDDENVKVEAPAKTQDVAPKRPQTTDMRKGAGKLMKFEEKEAPKEVATMAPDSDAPKSKSKPKPKEERKNGTETRETTSHRKSGSKQEPRNATKPPSRSDKPVAIPQHLLRKRDELLPIRKALPIWPHAESIRGALRKNNILVLTGETGSGKSTQVPQFLASEPWCNKAIAITQPRRVAAISLARRVSEEMGSFLGNQSPASKVGYSVRFDNAAGPNTKIKFLTEGMLLQEMLRDPDLNQYSAVVVDEVHERSVNVDLILGFLRNLVSKVEKGKRRNSPLKVVVMSATADVEGLVNFFGEGLELAQTSQSEKKEDRKAGKEKNGNEETSSKTNIMDQISTCYVEGRQFPVKTVYLPQPTQDWVETALKLIFQIHYKEPLPGDILVFLTGQDTIEGLEKLIKDYAEGMDRDVPKLLPLPLFAALPQHAQQLIFNPTPPRTRKVILATNIAETSVTVPGVRFVIDCGKSKVKQFRNRLGLESLLVKPISKSAAIQRKGRAGREAPGQCYRLYTEDGYKELEERTTPEILRCDLSAALLTLKARGVEDVLSFPLLDRPPREALEKALLHLLQLRALDESGTLSDVGRKIAQFPLSPTLGRVLVEAASRACLPAVIDIIAALSVENVFLNLVTEERKEEAEEARRELFRREGDHLTLLVTVRRYAEEHADRRAWCERHFVSHRAMGNVMNVRKQLRQQCVALKLIPADAFPAGQEEVSPAPTEDDAKAILASLLRGFVANTARLIPDGSYRTLMGNQTVAIHPSSVLFGRKTEALVFTEFVFTGRAWARGVSAVQLDWVTEVIDGMM
ncbi:ATP-dependent RNA helicase-like protein [Corynespora cassiicola Philippines]|uniref:RNA helicase n=1 Tax=Corynespora cassiicola Philippines TaxID=1448308 RepID=A0A2T2NC14_CORCC|nr:ATP-dependent RNA helicase-like protein [Corynespora cassiicola Philippines]